jgi:transposase
MAVTTMTHPPTSTTRVFGGVDTHKDVHVAAALDELGRLLGTESFRTPAAGSRQLLSWLRSHGEIIPIGIEGTGSWAPACPAPSSLLQVCTFVR